MKRSNDFFDFFNEMIEEEPLRVAEYIGKDRVYYVCMDARGLSEDEISLEVDDNMMFVTFNKKEVTNEIQQMFAEQLDLPFSHKYKFQFNNIVYDPNTIQAKLSKGLLSIKMLPRPEMKPLKKSIKVELN